MSFEEKHKRVDVDKRVKHSNTTHKDKKNNKKTNIRADLYRSGNQDKLQHTNGKPSYAEKAMKAGVYYLIADRIKQYKIEHLDRPTLKGLLQVLVKEFPNIFTKEQLKYPSNFGNVIDGDLYWYNAWHGNIDNIGRTSEMMLEHRILEGNATNGDLLKVLDIMIKRENIALKKEELNIKAKQLEAELNPVENTESDIIFGFDDEDEQVVTENEESQPE